MLKMISIDKYHSKTSTSEELDKPHKEIERLYYRLKYYTMIVVFINRF